MAEETKESVQADIGQAAIDFEPIGVKLYFASGKDRYSTGDLRLGISYESTLPYDEDLKLSSGEKVREDVSITVAVKPSAEPGGADPIGSMWYWPKNDDDLSPCPPTILINADLPKSHFEELLVAARLGKYPSRVGLGVEGLKYGWAPDGRAKEWDTADASKRKRNVKTISFFFPLGGRAAEEAAEMSAARASDRTDPQLGRIERQLESLRSWVSWATVGVVVIAIVLISRFF